MRDILQRNLGYKIISLILAISFWVWITSQTQETGLFGEHKLTVPLVTYNQPPNLVVISDIPTISVQLDYNNQGISVKDLFAYVDLTDAAAGEHSYLVYMDTPEGVELKDISPKNVVLRLDTVKDKIVPVIVDITGAPAGGFVAGQPIITPPVVNVRGPTSILEKLDNVVVGVDVTGMKESMIVARPVTFKDVEGKGIFAPDPKLESVNAFPATIEVIVPIYSKGSATKTVPLRAATNGRPLEGMSVRMVTPLPSQVLLLGDEEILKTMQYVNLGTVEISGLSSNKVVDIPLSSVKLPEGISFSEGTKLRVMIYIGPSLVDRIIKSIPVGINNIPEGMAAEAIPSIDLTVNAYPDILDALKPGDISAWVDASNLQPGTYPDTAVHWKAPSGITMVNVPKVQLVLNSTTPPPGDDTGQEGQKVNENTSHPVNQVNNN